MVPRVEETLDNGLRVVIQPRGGAPVVACQLWYAVGAADDPDGATGVSHLLEHLLFKGTRLHGRGAIDRISQALGGANNAYTSEDYTAYHFHLASDRWRVALELEADRMRGCLLDPADFEAERAVVLEEWGRDRDGPWGELPDSVAEALYDRHPYRRPILGSPGDLRGLTVERCREHYDRYYHPGGAVLSVAGEVEPAEVLEAARRTLGRVPRGPAAPGRDPPREPRRLGERRVSLHDDVEVARMLVVWRGAPVGTEDDVTLDALGRILGGGRSSRLHRRLVHGDRLATAVDAENDSLRDDGNFAVQVECVPGADPARVEEALLEEVERLARVGPPPAELARAKAGLRAAWLWDHSTAQSCAWWHGLSAVMGPEGWLDLQPDRVEALDAGRVQEAARRLLGEDGRVVGWLLPGPARTRSLVDRGDPGYVPPSPGLADVSREPIHVPRTCPRPRLDLESLLDRRLADGTRVLVLPHRESALVSVHGWAPGGVLHDPPGRAGMACLLGRMFLEGTERRDELALAEVIEGVGGALNSGVEGVSCRAPAAEVSLALELVLEVLRRSALTEEALGRARAEVLAQLAADEDDPALVGRRRLDALIFGEHPYGRPAAGTPESVRSSTREEVLDFHARRFGPEATVLVVAGAVDPSEVVARAGEFAARLVGPRRPHGTGTPSAAPRSAPPPPSPREVRVVRETEQCHLYLGHLGVARRDPDYDALLVMDHVLGSGPGFTDRISAVLREREGLAYACGGGICAGADLDPGAFVAYVGTSPALEGRALDLLRGEIARFVEEGPTGSEVEAARGYLVGSSAFELETADDAASYLVACVRLGLDFDHALRYRARIEAVDLEAVRRVARDHIHPDRLTTVVVGPGGEEEEGR
ncbi:MAG: insulinase family protein [Planctomycetes bacterium]|nr:insulinase family protein [Planctomycetota bacterium]